MSEADLFARELSRYMSLFIAFVGAMGLFGKIMWFVDDYRERKRIRKIMER